MKTCAKPLIVIIATLCTLSVFGQSQNWGTFDRLLVTQEFLNAIYPDLKHYEGLLMLRAVEFHTATGQGNVADLVPCKPGSGIVSSPNSAPGQVPLPHCGDGRFLSSASDFLTMDVTFGIKDPIRAFAATGGFVRSKSAPVEKQIAAHPEWNEQQGVNALRHGNPRFVPDNKTEFLKVVPADAIFKFTGCRLQLDSAEFHAFRQEGEGHSARGTVEWRVSGHRRFERTNEEDPCVARFEPFDAKLTYVGRL